MDPIRPALTRQASAEKLPPSTTTPLAEAASGLVGGLISAACTQPLDVVKTLMQLPGHADRGSIDTFKFVIERDGVAGLYAGLSSEFLKTAVQNFSYFYWYSLLKGYYASLLTRFPSKPALDRRRSYQSLVDEDNVDEPPTTAPNGKFNPYGVGSPKDAPHTPSGATPAPTPTAASAPTIGFLQNIVIGCLAGAATQLVANPLTLIQTRVMTDKRSQQAGFVGTLVNVVQSEGLLSLWNGLMPSLVLTLNPAIQFLVFDKLKAWWLRRAEAETPPRRHLSAFELMVIGSIAKIVATVITYPYIMAKTRLHIKSKGAAKYAGTLDVLQQVVREHGILGVYTGLSAQIGKSVLGSAILFMAKEKIVEMSARIAEMVEKKNS